MTERHLILRSFQSPGDVLMLTAAVRDLHSALPGQFATDVRTSAPGLWEHNPHLTQVKEGEAGVKTLEMHYPLIHESNQRPYHFIHGYAQYLEQQLGVKIPVTRFHGDVHLAEHEKQPVRPDGVELPERYWIVIAGGKYDFTAKWWDPERFQSVVDHFQGKLRFVQCGEAGHWHPRLKNVIDLVGKSTTRKFVRVMYHADGVLCPVTFAMHLAAAVPTPPGRPRHRACVVVAGGREPAHWEAYPQHQFISNNGALPCCLHGGCWKSRCQLAGDGDAKDRSNLCEKPVQVKPDLRIPRCMDLITAGDVIRRIELYYEGGALRYTDGASVTLPEPVSLPPPPNNPKEITTMNVLLKFRHGLGDAVQLTAVLQHLAHYHPEWTVDVAALVGKHSAFHGLCRRSIASDRETVDPSQYRQVFDLDWPENHSCYTDSPSTKVERCLRDVFNLQPLPDLFSYSIQRSPRVVDLARRYLEQVCKSPSRDGRFPAVLIHYEGNTSRGEKDLSVELVRRLCDDVLHRGLVPIILDWDRRTPLADNARIFNPDVNCELWGRTGTGDAEGLAALIELCTLMIGVDSGPLHVAGATTTPTIGVWRKHHPLHYYGPSANVHHLVPEDHERLLRGNVAAGKAYFQQHYSARTYRDLDHALQGLLCERLDGNAAEMVFTRNFWIRTANAEQDLVIVKDIAEDDSYRIGEIPMPRPVVVDVGAHIGCFARSVHERNRLARIVAVECCPENWPALEKNVGTFGNVVKGAVTYEDDVVAPQRSLSALRIHRRQHDHQPPGYRRAIATREGRRQG